MTTAHILVVDDERDLTELVRINLELAGFRVSWAHDGQEALDAIRTERPDLVLLDVMMPVVDGWGVLRELQADPALADLPVIMLTALAGERDVIRGHLSGALHYVTKPFDVRRLLETIQDALAPRTDEQRQRRREQLRGFLQRLTELDSGRSAAGPRVSLSRLDAPPRRPSPAERAAELLTDLTPRQREIASLLAAGVEARAIAKQLGTSRSNVYAARKRIARRLGVAPDDVAEAARAHGLGDR